MATSVSKVKWKKLLHKVVRISWADIVTSGGWTDKDKMNKECPSPHPCITVGYLSAFEKKGSIPYIIISSTQSWNDSDQFNAHVSIPIGCVSAVDVLE